MSHTHTSGLNYKELVQSVLGSKSDGVAAPYPGMAVAAVAAVILRQIFVIELLSLEKVASST